MDQPFDVQCAECSRLKARYEAMAAEYVEASKEFLNRIDTLNRGDYTKLHDEMKGKLLSTESIMRVCTQHKMEHEPAAEQRSVGAAG